jgi:hypothetical protein
MLLSICKEYNRYHFSNSFLNFYQGVLPFFIATTEMRDSLVSTTSTSKNWHEHRYRWDPRIEQNKWILGQWQSCKGNSQERLQLDLDGTKTCTAYLDAIDTIINNIWWILPKDDISDCLMFTARLSQCYTLMFLNKLVSVFEHVIFSYMSMLTVPWLEDTSFFDSQIYKGVSICLRINENKM